MSISMQVVAREWCSSVVQRQITAIPRSGVIKTMITAVRCAVAELRSAIPKERVLAPGTLKSILKQAGLEIE